jgi:5-methylcytosine-specific restriction endonuclease McrA
MSRQEFSRKTKAAIIDRAGGKCERCSASLKLSEGEIDHILPCALGGKPTIANGRLLCRVCHAGKTTQDVRRIREADRARDKHTGAVRPSSKLSTRDKRQPKRLTKQLPPRVRDVFGRPFKEDSRNV